MRKKDETLYQIILDEIKRFYVQYGRKPTQRELAERLNLSRACIQKYIKAMKEKGLIHGNGRYILTDDTEMIPIPIIDSLANHLHVYDKANIRDYVFISKNLFGGGEFGIVRAIDNSMIGANIKTNNKVLIKRQKHAESGQVILVIVGGQYLLRRYYYNENTKNGRIEAESINGEFSEVVTKFEIRGIALTIFAEVEKR